MQIINTFNLNEARKQIQKLKRENKEIIVQAQDNVFNRKIFENLDVDIVIGLEFHDRKDKLKQRDSGLNEVLCKLAKKNNIKIGIDIGRIKKLPVKDKAVVLSRVKQNIQLCRRTESVIVFFGKEFKNEDVLGFFQTLGGSTKQGKWALIKFKND